MRPALLPFRQNVAPTSRASKVARMRRMAPGNRPSSKTSATWRRLRDPLETTRVGPAAGGTTIGTGLLSPTLPAASRARAITSNGPHARPDASAAGSGGAVEGRVQRDPYAAPPPAAHRPHANGRDAPGVPHAHAKPRAGGRERDGAHRSDRHARRRRVDAHPGRDHRPRPGAVDEEAQAVDAVAGPGARTRGAETSVPADASRARTDDAGWRQGDHPAGRGADLQADLGRVRERRAGDDRRCVPG